MDDVRKGELIQAFVKLFPKSDAREILSRIARNSAGMFRFEYQEPRPLNGRTTMRDSDFVPLLFLANVGAEALSMVVHGPMLPAREGAGILQAGDHKDRPCRGCSHERDDHPNQSGCQEWH